MEATMDEVHVVTGASSGVGRALCKELAGRRACGTSLSPAAMPSWTHCGTSIPTQSAS